MDTWKFQEFIVLCETIVQSLKQHKCGNYFFIEGDTRIKFEELIKKATEKTYVSNLNP